ncbi:MAG: sugar phosphate nucleotidyltransferase [Pseudomonadota bacterium]
MVMEQQRSSDPVIHPVILCGGSGTRLWPVSRPARPKPFLPLLGETTLFQAAVARVAGDARFAAPMIVAGAQHADLIEQQMGEAEHLLVIEPEAKNTAPAIALAAALLPAEDILLVCPSDHHIADEAAFRKAALDAASLASQDYLTAFGITPTRAETGYGYLRQGGAITGGFAIAEFVEKPDQERAELYFKSGEYSWNGGIFAFRAGALLDELAEHRPAMAAAVQESVARGRTEAGAFYPDPQAFGAITGESIDYAVMENTQNAAMVPADMGWSDIGNWASLHDALPHDETGNSVRGEVDLAQCTNVLAISDGPRISAVGLEDICIIVSDGEVLVTTRDGAQLVGKLPGASPL